jgi:hypothetical protein
LYRYSKVPAVWVSKTRIECVTPTRDSVHTAHVTASNGEGSWSGHPLVYVRGSGTFLTFLYDNSNPGCQGGGCTVAVQLAVEFT